MTPAARRKDAADFAALDGVNDIFRADDGYAARIIDGNSGIYIRIWHRTRYRAVAMALAAYRAAREAGK